MIHLHLYAKTAETRVFERPADSSEALGAVPPGTWLGVLARQGDWVRIISHHMEGWVRLAETEERPPLTLHARWKPGSSPQYYSLAG